MFEAIETFFTDVLGYGFNHYKDFLFGLLIGMVVAWIYHKYVGNKTLKDSYEKLIRSKEETMSAYKLIIGSELEKIEVRKNKDFFKRVKEFFKAEVKLDSKEESKPDTK